MPGYDTIAPLYDRLSRLVFGQALVHAQAWLLAFIPAGSRVLIAGGGTGWILEELARVHAAGLVVDYVDNSAQMLLLAQQRSCGANKVHYRQMDILHFTAAAPYDVVITPFLFDNFPAETAQVAFEKISSALKPHGLWLFSDFHLTASSGFVQRLLLKVMYTFFRLTCGIAANALPDMDHLFEPEYMQLHTGWFYRKFIRSVVYKKTAGA
jgi:SAM-dependent methyltransferase